MSYTYDNIQLDCIDSSGTVLYNIATFTAATIPAVPVEGLAIGIKVRLTFTINSSGANSFLNKQLRFNPGLYVLSNPINALDFGYETLNPLSTTPQQAVLNVPIPTLQNIYCEMSKNAAPHDVATVIFEFYVTNDTTNFIFGNSSNSNVNRFLASSSLGLPNNIGQIVYNQTKNLSLGCKVFDSAGFDMVVTTPVGARFANILVDARWYNSDYLGYSLLMRYINTLEISSASQTAASLPLLTDATATGAQPNLTTIPNAIFTVTNNQLAVGEDNTVRILLRGEAYNGSVANPAISDIRVLFFRVDTALNNTDFVTDLQLSDAVIPQATPGSGQLNGAIYSPSDWFEDVPNPDDIEVQFTIDGSQLQINGQYYIVVNIHDSANPEYVTSHLSPLLTATYTAPAIPTLTGFISTYNTEYSGNELTIAPHQRIKARLAIDKASYVTALSAIGLVGNFNRSVAGIICRLTNVPGVVNQVQGFIPASPPITTADMIIVTNDATDLVLDCIFRIAEEYAGTSTEITWTISLNQPTSTNGITQFTQIDYVQKLDVDVFENDAITPNLLSIKFYDLADYILGIKTEIIDICDADQIIAEVEKDPTFTGSINFIATIYPANELGDTNNNAIEEESSWQPIVVQMQQLVSGKLDDVDASFAPSNEAIFKINVQQLTQGQRYWVTGIAYQQVPDYCPIGLVALTSTSTYRTVGVLPLWTITGNPTAVIAEILAHPDYVGGINVVQNNFVDNANSPIGVLSYAGNVVTAIKINETIGTAFYRFIVDADFDPGTGPHTIRHEILMSVPLPAPSLVPLVTFDNNYKCSDLG
jgi:hypothetical protein